MEIERYEAGVFDWVELRTTDKAAARGFYGEVFGWAFEEAPLGGASRALAKVRGLTVAAISQLTEDERMHHVPSHWSVYVAVDDLDAAVGRTAALGGRVVGAPFDVLDEGRTAVVRDPTGALLSLWQPKERIGAQLVNEPSTLCWNELHTRDLDAAARFYEGLLGWTVVDAGRPGPPLRRIELGGRGIGTMIEIQAAWGGMPPVWMVYFAVADCDRTLERAKAMGAKTFLEPRDVEGVGRFAGLEDPQGAHLFVIRRA